MKNKPTIDPAAGWAMVIAPKQVGDIIAVTAELQNPEGRVVASVVTERPEKGGLEAATRAAGNLLKEMLRLGESRSDGKAPPAARKEPEPQPTPEGAAEFPDPSARVEVAPEKVTPLNRDEPAVEDRDLTAVRPPETAPEVADDATPTDGDLQALEDACEAEGVGFVKPSSRSEAIDWMLGVREGRYETLPPPAEPEGTEDDEAEEAPAEDGEEAAHG